MDISYFQILDTVLIFFIFCMIILTVILRGFTYKALFGEYTGFIPIAGDIIDKIKIAQEYESPYNIKYLIISIINYILPYILYILFTTLSLIIISKPNSILFLISGLFFIFFSFLFLKMYYNYKIIFPFVYDLTYGDEIHFKTLIFTIFPFVFYIWIIVKIRAFERD